MISGIVYTSNSGYTAQYARLLGAALDLPVTDAKWGADPHPGRAVIYLGWLMAGKVQGYAKAAKEFDIRAVCAVGMGPASQAGAEKVRAKMGIPAEVPVFTLQGGFDINKLHGPYKWIMQRDPQNAGGEGQSQPRPAADLRHGDQGCQRRQRGEPDTDHRLV